MRPRWDIRIRFCDYNDVCIDIYKNNRYYTGLEVHPMDFDDAIAELTRLLREIGEEVKRQYRREGWA